MKNTYSGARVLVTGGLGFIGSNLCIALVEQGAEVTIVDSMIPGHGGNLFNVEPIRSHIHINFSDIRDPHSLRYLVQDKDVIFNLAAQVSHIDSMEDPLTDLDINARSQLALLETCRTHNPSARIIFTSTRQVYGKPQYLPVDEKHPLEPVDVNGVSNIAGEWYHLVYARTYGMPCLALRLTNTYGPRQKINNVKLGFVGTFLLKALQGEEIQIFGDGKQIRDFNFVDDVVEALLLAGLQLELAGQTFNLGHSEHYTLLEFTETLRTLAPCKVSIIPFPPERKRIDIGDYYSSYEKWQKATGWTPKTDLKTGLQKTVNYFRAHLPNYLA